MAAKLAIFCLSALSVLALVSSYAGEYIPKSYYIISDGHQSDIVYLRSKRSLLHSLRKRREASSPPHDVPFGAGGIPSPEQFFSQAQDFLNKLPHGDFQFPGIVNAAGFRGGQGYGSGSGSGGSAYSYSSASSSGGSGPDANHHYSNAGPGPQVQSRFGEGKGNGIHVSGSSSGPNGAFSSSSASSDGNGNVRYSVNTGKY